MYKRQGCLGTAPVNSAYVFDDRVVLNFNFTDDAKTVTREEVLGSSAVDNAPPQKSSDFRLRIFCLVAVQDSNRAALTTPVGRVSNQPSGLLLSPRFPTRRNVYRDDCRFVVGGTGREPERAKAGYHYGSGILPFALRNQVRFVRTWSSPYMARLGVVAAYVRTGSLYTSDKV